MKHYFKLISSLDKVFATGENRITEVTKGSMLKNEIYSFQMIGWYTGTELQRKSINIKIESPISDYISIKRVGFVPSLVPCFDYFSDDDYLRKIYNIKI